MPPQSSAETKKLVLFVALVVGALLVILTANVQIHDRTTVFSEGAGTPLRKGLEKLAANPTKCAMTLNASPDNERPMRHVNASIIGNVDVLVLGQSDADHMSKTFFRDDVHFYNGFVSNTCFAFQYEVFFDLLRAHNAPSIVLLDVGSGYILREGAEPDWNSTPNDPRWWGNPPFHMGKGAKVPWYRDLPNLLSLAQTELTLTWLGNQLPHREPPPDSAGTDTDNGEQFRCVSQTKKSDLYRWLADGSRVYAGELNGVLAPTKPIHITEAVGDRSPNPEHLKGLDWFIGQLEEAGSTVIVYSTPVHARVVADAKQNHAIQASGRATRVVTDRRNVDFCDLSLEGDKLGCVAADFADEVHISRHCNQRIIRALATGCAPRAGDKLKASLSAEVLR